MKKLLSVLIMSSSLMSQGQASEKPLGGLRIFDVKNGAMQVYAVDADTSKPELVCSFGGGFKSVEHLMADGQKIAVIAETKNDMTFHLLFDSKTNQLASSLVPVFGKNYASYGLADKHFSAKMMDGTLVFVNSGRVVTLPEGYESVHSSNHTNVCFSADGKFHVRTYDQTGEFTETVSDLGLENGVDLGKLPHYVVEYENKIVALKGTDTQNPEVLVINWKTGQKQSVALPEGKDYDVSTAYGDFVTFTNKEGNLSIAYLGDQEDKLSLTITDTGIKNPHRAFYYEGQWTDEDDNELAPEILGSKTLYDFSTDSGSIHIQSHGSEGSRLITVDLKKGSVSNDDLVSSEGWKIATNLYCASGKDFLRKVTDGVSIYKLRTACGTILEGKSEVKADEYPFTRVFTEINPETNWIKPVFTVLYGQNEETNDLMERFDLLEGTSDLIRFISEPKKLHRGYSRARNRLRGKYGTRIPPLDRSKLQYLHFSDYRPGVYGFSSKLGIYSIMNVFTGETLRSFDTRGLVDPQVVEVSN